MDTTESHKKNLKIAIIGSGPSGVAAASVLLEKGFQVDLYDGGEQREPDAENLKNELLERVTSNQQPTVKQWDKLLNGFGRMAFRKIASDTFNAVFRNRIKPEAIEKRNLGSRFAFRKTASGIPLKGLHLPRSLAIGGLSNVWGAASYPLRPDEYNLWPISLEQLSPWYAKAERILNLEYSSDGLSACYPVNGPEISEAKQINSGYLEPMLSQWEDSKHSINSLGLHFGRARIAVNKTKGSPDSCIYCGLCLSGCPVDSIWHSGKVLREMSEQTMRHYPGNLIHSFVESSDGIYLKRCFDGKVELIETRYDSIFLAAGALSSARIAAQSLRWEGEVSVLSNDMMVLPFRVRSKKLSAKKIFSLSEAVFAMNSQFTGASPAHMQLYRFSLPLLGPVANILVKFPEKLRNFLIMPFSKLLFGFVYLHSHDSVKYSAIISLNDNLPASLEIREQDKGFGQRVFANILGKLKKQVKLIGLSPLMALAKPTPAGFSCHIGGTMPMSVSPCPMQTGLDGRLFESKRCYIVDASVFPALPAQNLTLTIMANAMRVADGIKQEDFL